MIVNEIPGQETSEVPLTEDDRELATHRPTFRIRIGTTVIRLSRPDGLLACRVNPREATNTVNAVLDESATNQC
jgi:hypothetical protein